MKKIGHLIIGVLLLTSIVFVDQKLVLQEETFEQEVSTKGEVIVNTWPGGTRHAMSQSNHDKWNADNYPGTRQMCSECDQPTGNCEDDSHYSEDGEPLCWECYEPQQQKGR